MNTEYLNIQPPNFHFKIRLTHFHLSYLHNISPLIIKNEMGGFCFPLIRKKYCFGHRECQTRSHRECQTRSSNTSAELASDLGLCSCGLSPPFQNETVSCLATRWEGIFRSDRWPPKQTLPWRPQKAASKASTRMDNFYHWCTSDRTGQTEWTIWCKPSEGWDASVRSKHKPLVSLALSRGHGYFWRRCIPVTRPQSKMDVGFSCQNWLAQLWHQCEALP